MGDSGIMLSRGEVPSTAPPMLLSGMFVPLGIISDISGIVRSVPPEDVSADTVTLNINAIISAAIKKPNKLFRCFDSFFLDNIIYLTLPFYKMKLCADSSNIF